jgi:hypothetical protein
MGIYTPKLNHLLLIFIGALARMSFLFKVNLPRGKTALKVLP